MSAQTKAQSTANEIGFKVGDTVDVEWVPGEFWRDGKIIRFNDDLAVVQLPTGWHVYPHICDLRHKVTESGTT